jgi:nucleotide-binding universal stress UspA family protein
MKKSSKKTISARRAIWSCDPFESGGETRETVAQVLGFLNERIRASIEPVYVLSPADLSLQAGAAQASVRQFAPSAEEMLRKAMKALKVKGLRQPKVLIQRTPLLRDSIKALLAYAKLQHADLIVVGTHARTGVSRFLLGSFAESLLLQSKIPVLAINPSVKPRPVKRILFPTDFGSKSRLFFKKACALARELEAEVILHHAIPHPIEPVFQSGVYLLGGGWVAMPDYMRDNESRMRKLAEQWVSDGRKGGAAVSTVFDAGSAGIRDSILKLAGERDVDLIVIGAQSGPVAATLLGSVARRVVREARCAVWVMRE